MPTPYADQCAWCQRGLGPVPADERVIVEDALTTCGERCATLLRAQMAARRAGRHLTTRDVQRALQEALPGQITLPTHGRKPRIR